MKYSQIYNPYFNKKRTPKQKLQVVLKSIAIPFIYLFTWILKLLTFK